MMIGASFKRAASKQALIPDDETQLTAGMAYPGKPKVNKKQSNGLADLRDKKMKHERQFQVAITLSRLPRHA